MVTIALLIIGGILLIVFGFYETDLTKKILKGESKSEVWGYILLTVGAVFVMIGLAGLYSTGSSSGMLKSMRQRINEPIISKAQLYGYEIVGKHIEDCPDLEERPKCTVDLKDTFSGRVLKKVKINKGLFESLCLYNIFDETLNSKFRIPEKTKQDLQKKPKAQ